MFLALRDSQSRGERTYLQDPNQGLMYAKTNVLETTLGTQIRGWLILPSRLRESHWNEMTLSWTLIDKQRFPKQKKGTLKNKVAVVWQDGGAARLGRCQFCKDTHSREGAPGLVVRLEVREKIGYTKMWGIGCFRRF